MARVMGELLGAMLLIFPVKGCPTPYGNDGGQGG